MQNPKCGMQNAECKVAESHSCRFLTLPGENGTARTMPAASRAQAMSSNRVLVDSTQVLGSN